MPAFLSDEWLERLGGSLAQLGVHPDPSAATVVVEQNVVGDGGDVRTYHLVLGPGGVQVQPGAADAPDVVLHQARATAAAIARGELAPRAALADGRLTIDGDPGHLLGHLPLLAALDAATAELRAETTFPAG